jgi:hypothetical protein
MKLLLEGSLVALVLVCELAGLVALATRYTETTPETRPPAQESLTVIRSDDGGEAYRWVEWDGSSSSCGVVWKVRRAGDIVEANSSSESEGGIIGEAKNCEALHIRPHLATSRQPGVTARFSVIDPHRMMQTCGLTDGFVRTGIIALTYGQVSANATRC